MDIRNSRWAVALVTVLAAVFAVVAVPAPLAGATPQGEIWQWAIGRDLYNDPDLSVYTGGIGRTIGGACGYDYCPPAYVVKSAPVPELGFALVPDSTAGRIGSVELYNDESTMRPPGIMRAYQGQLPAGLSWDMTGADVQARYGDVLSFLSQGPISEVSVQGLTGDGAFVLELDFNTFDMAGLPDALMHKIVVSAGPNYPGPTY